MGLAWDLLEDATDLAAKGVAENRESCMRRSISTAYYAVFHLLIADFIEHWEFEDQRARLGRMFSHKAMKEAAVRLNDKRPLTAIESELERVKKDFGQLQQGRELADYDLAWRPEFSDVNNYLALAAGIFADWDSFRNEDAARHYLLSMFGARPPRPYTR